MSSGTQDHGVDPKLPTWNGDWLTFQDYVLRVELRADATKKDELTLLGPKLASNLTSRAFDVLSEIDREKLREEKGWTYLLNFLEESRGKAKVDVLGDLFTEFFLNKTSHRRDGEDLNDYEPRFRQLVRRLEKAVKETGSSNQLPTELFGWFLLNVYMRLDASDTANVRGRAETYKLEDVFAALKKMWSGGGLSLRDQERKKKTTQAYMVDEPEFEEPSALLGTDGDEDSEGVEEIAEATGWFQEALEALVEEPAEAMVEANFRDARKALDQARTARGFYPVKNPNLRGAKGAGKSRGITRESEHQDKTCYRCGKKGHISRSCPQQPNNRDGGVRPAGKIGFVGFTAEELSKPERNFAGHAEEEIQKPEQTFDAWVCMATTDEQIPGSIFGQQLSNMSGYAIVDSGASDNIVGIKTLEELADQLESLDFSAEREITVDHNQKKRFTFGNDQSDSALGKAYITTRIFGHEIEIEAHVVEGHTPFLLSAKFLADMNATINFRTGVAVFQKLGSSMYRLKRTPGNHLIIPLTAFAGHRKVFEDLVILEPDPSVQSLCSHVNDEVCFNDPEALERGSNTLEEP